MISLEAIVSKYKWRTRINAILYFHKEQESIANLVCVPRTKATPTRDTHPGRMGSKHHIRHPHDQRQLRVRLIRASWQGDSHHGYSHRYAEE